MSTNYAISSFIKLDDLKALTKIRSLGDTESIEGIIEVKINHTNELNQKVNYIKDSLGNYLIFDLYDRRDSDVDEIDYITSFTRFGSNNPDLIIDYIEEHCEVELVSEHEKAYWSVSRNSFDNHLSRKEEK